MEGLRRSGQLFFRYALQAIVHVQATGLQRIPRTGPVIIVNNHISFLDVTLTYLFAPRHLTGFSKVELHESHFFGPIMRFGGVIPIRRRTPDVEAVRRALAALEKDEALLVAPEGTRSHDGPLRQGRTGVVLLALRSGAPILPVAVWGQERFWRNLPRLLRTRVWIRVGHPFHLQADGERVHRAARERMLREVMLQLAALLPPAYRGVYADLESATHYGLAFPPGARRTLHLESE